MIIGKIKDLYRYKGLNVNLDKAIDFIITFPEDIHMPKISINNDFVEKAVCKVLVK